MTFTPQVKSAGSQNSSAVNAKNFEQEFQDPLFGIFENGTGIRGPKNLNFQKKKLTKIFIYFQ